MNGDGRTTYQRAASDAVPPTSSSYWGVPNLFLAGAYPGESDPEEHRAKVQALLAAGIRMFVNLIEEDETNYAGQPFVPYDALVRESCHEAVCFRRPIEDLSVPLPAEMVAILDVIDRSLEAGIPTYVHCWGGVRRTGTVVGGWLLRHRLATPENFICVLDALRQQDQERRHRVSPETPEQQRFVRRWRSHDTN